MSSHYDMSGAAAAAAPDSAVRWAHHPAEQLAHIAVHTPIQVPRGGAADAAHHPAAAMLQQSFQLPQGTPFTGLEQQTAQYQRFLPAQLSAAQLQQHNQQVTAAQQQQQQANYLSSEMLLGRLQEQQQQQRLQQLQQPAAQIVDWFDAQKGAAPQPAWELQQTSPRLLQRPQSAQQPPSQQQQQHHLMSPQPAYHHAAAALLSPTQHSAALWHQQQQQHLQRSNQLLATPPHSTPSSTAAATPNGGGGLLTAHAIKRSPSAASEPERRRSPLTPAAARSCFTSPQPQQPAADSGSAARSSEETNAARHRTASENSEQRQQQQQHFEQFKTILDLENENGDREKNPSAESVEKASLEASRLLLNLSGSEHSSGDETAANAEITVDVSSDATAVSEPPKGSTETSVDAAIASVLTSIASPIGAHTTALTATTAENGSALVSTAAQKNRSFFRPPGSGAPADAAHMDSNVLTCAVCGFSCTSKFHYNSHMNTHSDHKCVICNYTSRTEGRLKKHMADSHTLEDRIAHGVEVPTSSSSSGAAGEPSPIKDLDKLQQELSSTMVSLIESANRVAASEANGDATSPAAPVTVSVGDAATHSSAASAFTATNPLDQIRALTEKNAHGAALNGGAAFDPANITTTLNSILNASSSCGAADANGGAAEVNGAAKPKESRRSGAGKPKSYKCKQCGHISQTKEDQWRHVRIHIPLEKQLTCQLCEFVTEYKHHLEYHIRNHNGEKPFQCKECNYQCVNKSMLNSHMKSHNSLYQFKCQDCAYQTKYCHSLKMHLHKYNHRRAPGTQMSDGDANEALDFDVDPVEGGSSMAALHQLSQQFRADPSVVGGGAGDEMHAALQTPVTSAREALRNILTGPVVTSASLQQHQQYAMHQLRQQQMEQMQELLRNANAMPSVMTCRFCDYQTFNRDEFHQHIVGHMQSSLAAGNSNLNLANPTLASLLTPQLTQNAAGSSLMLPPHMQPLQLPTAGTLSSAALQQVNLLREQLARAAHYAAHGGAPERNGGGEPTTLAHRAAAHAHAGDFAAYGGGGSDTERARPATETSHDADESSSSPTGSKMSVDESGSPASDHSPGGSRKRKAQKNPKKLEDTVKRLREKSSPETSDEHEYSADSGHSDPAGGSTAIVSSLPQPIPTSFFTQLNGNAAPQERQRAASTMYTCQHCAITFQDLALYQIHLGYHSYENPYKCNRCGQVCPGSLEFNLHLYQDKHDVV